jgi:hypothetical protein
MQRSIRVHASCTTDQPNGTQGISDSNQSIGLNEMLLISRNFGFVPGTSSPHLRRDSAHPCPHLHRDSARRRHICTGTRLRFARRLPNCPPRRPPAPTPPRPAPAAAHGPYSRGCLRHQPRRTRTRRACLRQPSRRQRRGRAGGCWPTLMGIRRRGCAVRMRSSGRRRCRHRTGACALAFAYSSTQSHSAEHRMFRVSFAAGAVCVCVHAHTCVCARVWEARYVLNDRHCTATHTVRRRRLSASTRSAFGGAS